MALLLWGMRMVRTGVTRTFGAGLRQMISNSVSNRFRALLVGLGVTAIFQSSTATAMMVASFASRGLMATAPALAVLLGADVGTTIVAQVLSFDISSLSPLLLAGGLIAHFSASRAMVQQVGRTAIGLGLMLLALKMIVESATPLRESLVIHELFGSVAGDAVIGVLIAALLTWLTHSSLAVVLLIMSLVASGTIPMQLALALVIGANLGGTLPPIMATLASGPEARRVTFGNAMFKLIGCIVCLPLLGWIMPALAGLDPTPARQVVNFHTAFNLALAAGFILLTDQFAALLRRLVPAPPAQDDPKAPRYLDYGAIDTPAIALASAARETLRMGDYVESMLQDGLEIFAKDDTQAVGRVRRTDDVVDRLHEQIKFYVTKVTRQELDDMESQRASEIIAFATNLEHIGDIAESLTDLAERKVKEKVRFSDAGLKDLTDLHGRVSENLKLAMGIFMSGDVKLARHLLSEKRALVTLERRYSERHIARLREGRPESIETSALHMDILRDLKRIHSHVVAVAYPVLERAGELRALPSGSSHEKRRFAD